MSNRPISPSMPVNDLYLESIGFVFTPHLPIEYMEHVGQMYINFNESAIYCIENMVYIIAHQGKCAYFGKIETQKKMQDILLKEGIPMQNFELEDLALID